MLSSAHTAANCAACDFLKNFAELLVNGRNRRFGIETVSTSQTWEDYIPIFLTSTKRPAIAAAAAISGESRWVRPL